MRRWSSRLSSTSPAGEIVLLFVTAFLEIHRRFDYHLRGALAIVVRLFTYIHASVYLVVSFVAERCFFLLAVVQQIYTVSLGSRVEYVFATVRGARARFVFIVEGRANFVLFRCNSELAHHVMAAWYALEAVNLIMCR